MVSLWDRALDSDFSATRSGDSQLRDIVQFHGLVQSDGLLSAVEVDPQQAERARSSFVAFGLKELADLVERGQTALVRHGPKDEVERELDDAYARILPTDQALIELVKLHVASHPDDFEPL